MADKAWRDLGVRVLSAMVLIPVGLLVIWLGGAVWSIWLAVMAAGMAVEWVGLCGRHRGARLAGIVYIGPACVALFLLRQGPAGFRNVLFIVAVVSAGDIGAYLLGRLAGGPRLAPHISPGKTWSGAAGGLLAAGLAGVAAGFEQPVRAALLAAGMGVVAQAGDLLESAIKRRFGAKDSGWIIPGHGGLLDRLDGVLAAAPAALLWSFWVGTDRALWQ